MITNAGTHRVRHANSVANEAPNKSSISSLKQSKRTMTNKREIKINNADSHKNIQYICPVDAPLHLCTPTDLARCGKEEIEISTLFIPAISKIINPRIDRIFTILRDSFFANEIEKEL